MTTEQVQRSWIVGIGVVGPLIAYWYLQEAIGSVGTYYEGNNSGIRFAIALLLISALSIAVSGLLVAKMIDTERDLARFVIQTASVLAGVCLIGVAWSWSMIPNLQAEGYRAISGYETTDHQILVTTEGSATFLGAAMVFIGAAALCFVIGGEFTGRVRILATVTGFGAVWVILLGFSIGMHTDELGSLAVYSATIAGLLYLIVAGIGVKSATNASSTN